MLKILSGAVLASLVAGAASAATIAFAPTPTSDQANLTPNVGVGVTTETGSLEGQYRSPYDQVTDGLTFSYTSIGADESATYVFEPGQNSLSFVWGSPDTYNELTFTYDDNSTETFKITDFANYTVPLNSSNSPNSLVTLYTDDSFKSVTFASVGLNAFEIDGVSAAVPLPAAGLLLLGALGVMGAARRRKTA